ncbi:aminopeptidase P family protein [Candidatus Bipolaricaulota bacterium]|nr:aminopeptidase P family protein [Candidatus Bipolaricaulota bacterium]
MQSLQHQKTEQVQQILQEAKIDCWLIWVRETSLIKDPVLPLIYDGDLVWPSALLYTRSGERVAIVGNFDAGGVPEGLFDRVIPYNEGISETLVAELTRIDPASIAINESLDDVAADGLTAGMKALLLQVLSGTPYVSRLVSASPVIGRLRGRKTPQEIERIEQAVGITESIFAELHEFLVVGQTELAIHRFVHERMEAHNVGDAWQANHNPAVDAGPNKAFGHLGPTETRTKEGQLLHLDFGVRFDGYCSDLQRMFFFGPPTRIPTEVAAAFDAVRGAIAAAADRVRPGALGHQVDSVARRFLSERGYAPFQHALGHQIGRAAHDGGTLLGPLWERYGDAPNGILESGNVFTLELYATTKHYGQVSLEEDIVVTGDGCRFLSHPQQKLLCVQRG